MSCFFHELTHIFQNYSCLEEQVDMAKTGIISCNNNDMQNEVLVQFISEEIYRTKYNLSREVKEYNSEDLRMLPGLKIYSDLDNYQHFDYITNKYFLFFNIDKYELSRISFLGERDIVEKYFQKKYSEVNTNYKVIENYLEIIYLVDKIMYTGSDEDIKLISGKDRVEFLYKNKKYLLNRKLQFNLYVILLDYFGEQKLKRNNI